MTTVAVPPGDTKRPNAFVRLYRGETSFDFVGRRRLWYLLSALIIVAGIVSLSTRGFNLGIDFKGGTEWQIPANGLSISTVTKAVQAAGVPQPVVQELGTGSNASLEVQGDLSSLSGAQHQAVTNKVVAVLAGLAHTPQSNVAVTDVGPTWGSEITKKAIIAVIVFFIVVVVYISFRFEWKMALAALVAVLHDLLVTAGIYSLFGFQVTPDTVIAILTILGYSLYDTVVVFDRIRESTRGTRRVRAHDLRRRGQPVDEPGARPVHQHLAGRHLACALGAGDRCGDSRSVDSSVLRSRPCDRAHLGCVLLDLHRFADPLAAERARAPIRQHPPEAGEPRHARGPAHSGSGGRDVRCGRRDQARRSTDRPEEAERCDPAGGTNRATHGTAAGGKTPRGQTRGTGGRTGRRRDRDDRRGRHQRRCSGRRRSSAHGCRSSEDRGPSVPGSIRDPTPSATPAQGQGQRRQAALSRTPVVRAVDQTIVGPDQALRQVL